MKKLLCGMLAIIACLGLSACGSDEKKEETKTEKKEEKKTSYAVGEEAEVAGLKVKVNQTRIDEGLIAAKDDKQYFVIEMTITNNTEDTFSSSSMMCYTLKDADGRKLDMSIGANLNGSLDMKIEPGETGTGEIAFEAAPEGKLTLTFEPFALKKDNVRFEVR